MKLFTLLAATAATAASAGLAMPASAQTPYPYGYQQTPQPYPGQPGYGYPQAYPQAYPGYAQPAYGSQGYAPQNTVQQIIDGLLGNRYATSDRTKVSQCATAALAQAQAQGQYRGYGSRYGQAYGQPYGSLAYGYANTMRVTAITDVQRRSGGLRVKGTIATGMGSYGSQYGQYSQYGYNNSRYAAGDLNFRCNVDYRGAVTNVKVSANNNYRR